MGCSLRQGRKTAESLRNFSAMFLANGGESWGEGRKE